MPEALIEPLWLTLSRTHLGTSEIVGKQHNSKVVAWIRNFASWIHDDETPWCAAFANSMLIEAGVLGSKQALRARGFEDKARFRLLSSPRLGCIVTFHNGNPSSGQGHVFFYLGETEDGRRIRGIGGNQGNKVSEAWFPRSRMTGMWWPKYMVDGSLYLLPKKVPPIILRDDGSPVPSDR